jgi:hypothetical protein
MNLQENRRADIATHLRRQGFKLQSQLTVINNHTISIPAFGLCSYAALYCGDEAIVPEVADALSEVPGIDFSVYRDGQAVVMKGSRGSARIELKTESAAGQTRWGGSTAWGRQGFQAGEPAPAYSVSYRYLNNTGDPLGLMPIVNTLRANGGLDQEGFASDAAWFDQTQTHLYPDALRNIYTSIHTNRVKHTADVLVSLRDGYYYGWSPFGHLIRLAATHGNALRSSSNAFLMSTHRQLPSCVRADDAGGFLKG